MAEIITEPNHAHVIHSYEDRKAGSGVAFLAIAVVVLLAAIFFYYAMPYISGLNSTQVNIPDKINVNINKAQ